MIMHNWDTYERLDIVNKHNNIKIHYKIQSLFLAQLNKTYHLLHGVSCGFIFHVFFCLYQNAIPMI